MNITNARKNLGKEVYYFADDLLPQSIDTLAVFTFPKATLTTVITVEEIGGKTITCRVGDRVLPLGNLFAKKVAAKAGMKATFARKKAECVAESALMEELENASDDIGTAEVVE